MVEGRDGGGPGRGAHDLRAVGIVGAHDRVVVEKFEVGAGHRPLDELEPIGREGRLPGGPEPAGVDDRHLAILEIDADPAAVAPVAVAPGQHLAIAVERRFHRRTQVAEGTEASTVRGRFQSRSSHDGDPLSSLILGDSRACRQPPMDRLPPGHPPGMSVQGGPPARDRTRSPAGAQSIERDSGCERKRGRDLRPKPRAARGHGAAAPATRPGGSSSRFVTARTIAARSSRFGTRGPG